MTYIVLKDNGVRHLLHVEGVDDDGDSPAELVEVLGALWKGSREGHLIVVVSYDNVVMTRIVKCGILEAARSLADHDDDEGCLKQQMNKVELDFEIIRNSVRIRKKRKYRERRLLCLH